MLEKHNCMDCKYFYYTERETEETRYNPLSDRMESVTVKKEMHEACGVSAGGIFLDPLQPKCASYEGVN